MDFISVEEEEKELKDELVPEKVLAVIEEAYPNSLTIDDMSHRFKAETEVVRQMVLELVNKKLVKPVGAGVPGAAGLDSAAGAFRRVHQNEEEVTIVKQMPRGVEKALQPTIAVITAQYFEKMAVDAMMTNKQTFMRYATVGKSMRSSNAIFALKCDPLFFVLFFCFRLICSVSLLFCPKIFLTKTTNLSLSKSLKITFYKVL